MNRQARQMAKAVIRVLCKRKGFDWWCKEIDDRTKVEIHHALRSALVEQAGWRPMDSAPKDGSLIVLAVPIAVCSPYVVAGYWQEAYDRGGQEPDCPESWVAIMPYHAVEPFAWMPLPAPPVQKTD